MGNDFGSRSVIAETMFFLYAPQLQLQANLRQTSLWYSTSGVQVVVEVASAVASGVSPAGPIYAICWRFASFVDSVLYNPLGISIMAAMFGICFGVDRKLMRRANGVDDGKTPWYGKTHVHFRTHQNYIIFRFNLFDS